jgi:hypothetical protein
LLSGNASSVPPATRPTVVALLAIELSDYLVTRAPVKFASGCRNTGDGPRGLIAHALPGVRP